MNIAKILESIKGFQWDSANISHIAKHDVVQKEAEDVFFDSENVLNEDLEHSKVEHRFLVIGKTKDKRILYQIFTIREDKIRIISSRDINKRELTLYSSRLINKAKKGGEFNLK